MTETTFMFWLSLLVIMNVKNKVCQLIIVLNAPLFAIILYLFASLTYV